MLEKDDVFKAEGKLYCVLDITNYNGHEYCMCNEMQDEKTFGANYRVFENFDDGIEHVEEDDLLNTLAPIFSANINTAIYSEDSEETGEEN